LVQPLILGVSAQLGTLPLSLYYFHQFPCYFWLSGWAVMLGGSVFLAGGALLMLFDAIFAPMAWLIGQCLWYLSRLLNSLIFAIQDLPGGVIEGIQVSGIGLWLWFMLVVALALLLENKRKIWLMTILSLAGILAAERAGRLHYAQNHPKIVVYHAGKFRLTDFYDGSELLTLTDSMTEKRAAFAAQGARIEAGLTSGKTIETGSDLPVSTRHAFMEYPFAGFYGERIVFIDGSQPLSSDLLHCPSGINIVVFSRNPKLPYAQYRQAFANAIWVFDATNSHQWTADRVRQCTLDGIRYHDVRNSGAWVHFVHPK
jgi:competence protein ComEC